MTQNPLFVNWLTGQPVDIGVVSVTQPQFGAELNGTTDDATAINAALSSGASRVIIPGNATTVVSVGSVILIPAGVSLIMDYGVTIKPNANITRVVKVHAGAWFEGRIDTSGITFTGTAVDFDGDDNNDAQPFRLNVRSGGRAILIGGVGAGTGSALKLHADGVANARIMGVEFIASIEGFEFGVRLRQTSTDLTKFCNGNRITAWCDNTLRALYMESSHVNGFGVDGNTILMQMEPNLSTTVAAFQICGQNNYFDLYPYDWNLVVGGAPNALVITPNVRWSVINWRTLFSYILNNSNDPSNLIIDTVDGGIIYANQINAPTQAGTNLIRDVPNATGSHIWRLNGGNVAFFGSSIGWQIQSKREQMAQGAAVASANNLTLGTDGNRFQISGTTQINLLDSTNWQGGAIVTLLFQGILTVANNQAASGSFKPIVLAGAANLTTAAKNQLTLQFDSTDQTWYEIARKL